MESFLQSIIFTTKKCHLKVCVSFCTDRTIKQVCCTTVDDDTEMVIDFDKLCVNLISRSGFFFIYIYFVSQKMTIR